MQWFQIPKWIAKCVGEGAMLASTAYIRIVPVGERVLATATNGKIWAATWADGKIDGPVLAHHEMAGKGTVRVADGETVARDGDLAVSAAFGEGRFPPIQSLAGEIEGRTAVSLDARLLRHLANAIDDEGRVTMFLGSPTDEPIIVSGRNGVGMIVPLSGRATDGVADRAKVQLKSVREALGKFA